MPAHAIETIIARGNTSPPNPEEVGHTGEPEVVLLYLDDDERYRWYREDGTATTTAANTIHSVLAGARMQWPTFELMEYRGLLYYQAENDVPERYASDEIEELRRAAKSS